MQEGAVIIFVCMFCCLVLGYIAGNATALAKWRSELKEFEDRVDKLIEDRKD
jgi:hypothetical protein